MPPETRQNRMRGITVRQITVRRIRCGLVWLLLSGGLLPAGGFSREGDPSDESGSQADSATLVKDRVAQTR